MAASFAVDTDIQSKTDVTKGESFYVGTITLSGSYTAGGDTLSFGVPGIQSNAAPLRVEIYEEPLSTGQAVGDIFVYAKGTTSANGKLQILTASGTPFAGAYGATFANTIIKARAWFPLGQ